MSKCRGIRNQPLAEQLTRIHATIAHWTPSLRVRGQHVTDSNAEHVERMRGIEGAEGQQ
ncbi:hypothetical protein [Stutzerimonas stutzeri]|uniref:hypothetical protein n=1 Tax=Stutzerimonas stutzeri TaxID=316 RepID=UPI002109B931|nr:hypothetical protein [Stutzerimonas stutzeri]MCQ4320695.1 hypothetical protein [Stutzerimonas stutzeri]